jgi:hypothetical protein
MRPHIPFIAPKRYWDYFDPDTPPMHLAAAGLPRRAPSILVLSGDHGLWGKHTNCEQEAHNR